MLLKRAKILTQLWQSFLLHSNISIFFSKNDLTAFPFTDVVLWKIEFIFQFCCLMIILLKTFTNIFWKEWRCVHPTCSAYDCVSDPPCHPEHSCNLANKYRLSHPTTIHPLHTVFPIAWMINDIESIPPPSHPHFSVQRARSAYLHCSVHVPSLPHTHHRLCTRFKN